MALGALEAGVQGLRLNPGNIRKPDQIKAVASEARDRGVPIRIGVNGGSLDPALYEKHGGITPEAMVESAMQEMAYFHEVDFDLIKISVKASNVPLMVEAYRQLSEATDVPLHLGVTEAGPPPAGLVKATAGIGTLLLEGIGDTIRYSLTPEPGGDRTLEVKVAQELLQTMGFRVFVPLVAACPGCGRTTSTTFQELARDIQGFIHTSMPEWKRRYPGVESLNVAVMGCIVNGPGESKHADIGISLPGTGEQPAAPVFVDGKKVATLRGATVAADFKQMVIDYIERRFGEPGAGRTAAE
jgi:(E)-4-hydroxy-3-methylbut-2-enyl-diphosphate synthase